MSDQKESIQLSVPQSQVIELQPKDCALIALYAYEQWQEAIKPSVLTYSKDSVLSFEQWLKKIIADADNQSTSSQDASQKE